MALRTRLTVVTAALMAMVLGAVGTFVYIRLRADLTDAVDAGLRSRADAILPTLEETRDLGTGAGLAEPDDAFAQILSSDGMVLASSPGLAGRPVLGPDAIRAIDDAQLIERTVRTAEEPVSARLLALPVGSDRILVVGSSLDDRNEALARLAVIFAVGGPVALALATVVGWVVAGAALRPVERMRAEAAAISTLEPGRRLAVPGTRDELARLSATLNEMLDRLEQALLRERRFVDEASHELRTPLSNLRVELDLALRRSRSVDELQEALRSAAEESDRLVRLAEDLLVLARADRGRLPVRRERVELAPVVAAAIDDYARRAEAVGVAIDARVPPGLAASVDPLRLRQVLGNLVDNALRHTGRGGNVTVRAASEDGWLVLEVRDSGEGFPEAFLARAFEAFARPDAARSRRDGAAGLGLAIVRAVAEAHGGTALAENHPQGGASVTVRMPQ
ncbi:MAG TPA: ATP-binding protein [Actinomycetota bacterium]|nr:ATP-binding protein [Actinomycetota bacterium]